MKNKKFSCGDNCILVSNVEVLSDFIEIGHSVKGHRVSGNSFLAVKLNISQVFKLARHRMDNIKLKE